MKKNSSLRRRWLINTVGIVCALGMVCVLAVTAFCAVDSYNDLQTQLQDRAESAVGFLNAGEGQSREAFLRECADFVSEFDQSRIRVLLVQADEDAAQPELGTDLRDAMSTRAVCTQILREEDTGLRVMAVSAPLIYSDGQVVGALRFTMPTKTANVRIFRVALAAFVVLVIVVGLVYLSGSYFIHSVMFQVTDLTEKAKKISAGSYGIQIPKRGDDEIGELTETINELSSKISQNEKMQAEFISQLSHELRTPLTVINGWSETLLMDENMDGDTRQGMKIISREAKRLTEMVVELLDFTRMQDGRMTLHVEQTDVCSEFEDTVFMYGSRLSQEGITLNYIENDDDIPEIPCDPQRLRQVWLNVLDNAAKHGGDGGRIDASIHMEAEQVVVRIRDYGPGIPEDEIPLVKKKFFKGSSKARGTGIGLAVCDEIVEMHGGSLMLENAEGGGTLVTIALPVVQ